MFIQDKKLYQYLFLLPFLIFLGFSASSKVLAVNCSDVPITGAYTITASCSFAGTVNGIENGNLTIDPGQTLTIANEQTVVWNSGYSVIVNGTIAISKGGNGTSGGQLRKTNIWLTDADNDNFPDNFNMIASDSTTTNGYRRSSSRFVDSYSACGVTTTEAMTCGGGRYLDGSGNCVTTDANYYSPVCNNSHIACETCEESDAGAASCDTCADGQGCGCTADCKQCSSGSCVNCANGQNCGCTAYCKQCSSGSCVNCSDGQNCGCTAICHECDSGSCRWCSGSDVCGCTADCRFCFQGICDDCGAAGMICYDGNCMPP